MPYNPEKHHRRSIRLKGFDYNQPGGYFVTIVIRDRECIFGEIKSGEMILSKPGWLVRQALLDLPRHYPHVRLDEWCVMPNHIHVIFMLLENPEDQDRRPLSEVVRALKAFSARRINQVRNSAGCTVWQRNYYEHVIRDDEELARLREYIRCNPINWSVDQENPSIEGV